MRHAGSEIPTPRPHSVVIIDDHAILRNGLRRILEEHSYSVIGEAGNAAEARQVLSLAAPSVVILDIGLPGVRGIELAGEILRTSPDRRIIFLTAHNDAEFVYQALSIGVAGYVLKDCFDTEIVSALRSVEQGKRYLTPLISDEIVKRFSRSPGQSTPQSEFDSLTARERAVLSLICDGKSNKEIASSLFISARTAEHHRQAVMKKTKARSMAELIKLAIKNKLIEL